MNLVERIATGYLVRLPYGPRFAVNEAQRDVLLRDAATFELRPMLRALDLVRELVQR